MDPLSALLLAIMASGMTVQTVAAGLADARAARQGRQPPSKQKWAQRQDQRAARGQLREPDPGPWRRRWRNLAEARTEKLAPKHAARMEHLRDNAEHMKARHRRRIERRAQRRDRMGSILAGWGHTSWEGTKNAAIQAREDRVEKQAWAENQRRDQLDQLDNDEEQPDRDQDDEEHQARLAPVVPFPTNRDPNPGNPLWPGSVSDGDPPSYNFGRRASEVQEGQVDPSQLSTRDLYLTEDHFGFVSHIAPDHYSEEMRTAHGHVQEELAMRGIGPYPDPESFTEGGHTMSHSGEITDLPSAISYCQATAQYCDMVSATFETSLAQARTSVTDLQQQAAALETAQSSLAGQGMDGEIQTHLVAIQERFASLVQQMQETERLLSATQEEVASARADATSATSALESQQGIAEQLQSQQVNGVASDTRFYTNA